MEWTDFQGVNRAYVLERYEQYQRAPRSADTKAAGWLEQLPAPSAQPEDGGALREPQSALHIIRGLSLVQSIRQYGHLAATVDPLGRRPPGDPALELSAYGITEQDLRALPATLVTGPAALGAHSLADVVDRLRQIYCGTTGYDFAHVSEPDERRWLRAAVESGRFRAPADPIDPVALLARLTRVEAFERFLHRSFPGQTRFSIEGLDMLVPVLDEVICGAGDAGLRRAFIGMAHRGRLNVMAHVLGKRYEEILALFKGRGRNTQEIEGVQWTGDVKYHLGASRMVDGGEEVGLVVSMPPNPSHLEAINPVIEGMARAAGTRVQGGGAPEFDPDAVLPIVVHGDAAFPGQGIVAETLNLHRLAGYTTGGTIHLIANNQLGFTTEAADAFSTASAAGLAAGFRIPILHVNADDPEACVAAARMAIAYRQAFKRDVLIDLVGYRRFGHNEGDEPSFTQPLMYAHIATHPTVRQMWAHTLESRGLIDAGRADVMLADGLGSLGRALGALDLDEPGVNRPPTAAQPDPATGLATGVPLATLRGIHDALLETPANFHIHRKLQRARDRRRHAFDTTDAPTIDWAAAEELAWASILADGTQIRLTGEDVERGTFSQRHAVLFDVLDGHRHTPLQAFAQARATFEIHNSPLTENAAIGFEYGYNIEAPDRLVIWEAQYGDFLNGAQTMLDEFVLSARAKWGQTPSLVLLLPHGNEGQGPDHSSARFERLLQLAADLNVCVATCTTAAQYFHVLRRQAAQLMTDPVPLVVLTPKSLLRHPSVASRPIDLAEGQWHPVINDADRAGSPGEVRRLILCSGKVGVEMIASSLRPSSPHVAICRIEQLYPLPETALLEAIERYVALQEVVWVQEEPENMGAWESVRHAIEELAGTRRVAMLGRPRSSSPAEGSAARHARMQEELIARALDATGRSGRVDVPMKS